MSEKTNRKLTKQKAAYQKAASRIARRAEKQNSTVSPAQTKDSGTHIWEVLAFVLPFILFGISLYVNKMHPFGDRQFLVTDLWHQYYPFYQVLEEKLSEGGSLLYTWRSGLGTNFLSLMAYYCASPLNVLAVFVPQESLRDAMLFILMLKFSFAGLFFARMLRYVFGKNDLSITVFAVMYALCSFMMGYYWNTIWIDTVALLPLVMHGLTALVREGKYRTYVIALALALLTNYYIAYFICIFTVLAFFCLCWFENTGIKKFGKRFALITGSSLFGAGLSAWILLPAYFALQLTHSASNSFPTKVTYYEGWRDIIANMLAFNEVTSKEGLPNLYCGLLPVLLLGAFLIAKKIRLREKIVAIVLLAFLIVSCNMNVLNFIWHGFHFTNMIPYRFSFLFSFVLLVAAYRAYQVLLEEKLSIWQWLGMAACGAVFCFLSYGVRTEGEEPNKFVIASAILGGVYLVVVFFRKFLPRQAVQVLLAAVVAFEMGQHAVKGVESVGSSSYDGYPASNEAVQEMLAAADEMEDEEFYRTELTMWYTLNDPAMYCYDGVSQFSSMANARTTTFMRQIGMPASEAGNRYYYANTSPLSNMLLNVQYIIAKDGYNADELTQQRVDESGKVMLYKNLYDLSMGYMIDSNAPYYVMDSALNPFQMQNVLFERMTGVSEDLFTQIDITHVGHQGYDVTRRSYGSYNYTRKDDAVKNSSFLKYNYTTISDGMVYGYMKVSNGKNMDVYYNDTKLHSYNIGKQPYITPLGSYKEGELVTLRCELGEDAKSGSVTVYFYQLNEDVLKEGYAALADEVMTLTDFEDTSFSGEITAKEDGCLYLSVPYEEGWTLYVDGEKAELIPVFKAMCGVQLTAGTHTIEMRYSPKGFVLGLMITIGCAGLFVVLLLAERRRKKNPSAPEAEKPEETASAAEEEPAGAESKAEEETDKTESEPKPEETPAETAIEPIPEEQAGETRSEEQNEGGEA